MSLKEFKLPSDLEDFFANHETVMLIDLSQSEPNLEKIVRVVERSLTSHKSTGFIFLGVTSGLQ